MTEIELFIIQRALLYQGSDFEEAIRIIERELRLKEIEKNPTGAVMTGCIRCHKIHQEFLTNCPYCNYPAQEKNVA